MHQHVLGTLKVGILVIGLGWQGRYVQEQCILADIQVAATTTTGRDATIPFAFSTLVDLQDYKRLPEAQTILLTFPLPTLESPFLFADAYAKTHLSTPNMVLLGSTRVFDGNATWSDRHGPATPDARFLIEEQFLSHGGCVLNLAGLHGGSRQMPNWIPRVAATKTALSAKGSLHLIHGVDVARLVIAVHGTFTPKERWIVTDMHVYDWWSLIFDWDTSEERRQWVAELMESTGQRALPRPTEKLGRALDSTETWHQFKLLPTKTLSRQ